MTSASSSQSQRGFSLVEVALAIGIVAVAFLALFGLLPSGMNTYRKALDTSLTTEIADRIVNDLKQSDFDTLAGTNGSSSVDGTSRYFTDQGDEVLGASSTTRPTTNNWLYYGEIYIMQSSTTQLPGSTVDPSKNLLTVTIVLGADPSRKDKPFGLDPAHKNANALPQTGTVFPYRTFTTLIARNQTTTKNP